MQNTPTTKDDIYRFDKESLILRDLLATDRTFLANERTFLAYIRTALSLIVAGSGFIKLAGILLIEIIGYLLLPLGFIIGFIGLYRFIKTNQELKKIKSVANYEIH